MALIETWIVINNYTTPLTISDIITPYTVRVGETVDLLSVGSNTAENIANSIILRNYGNYIVPGTGLPWLSSDYNHSHDEFSLTDHTHIGLDILTGGSTSDADALHTHDGLTTVLEVNNLIEEAITGNIDLTDFVRKDGSINQLSDITSTGVAIEDTVSKAHDEAHTILEHTDDEDPFLMSNYKKLVDGSNADCCHTHSFRVHNDLEELDGGVFGEYYHFTQSQHDTLIDGSDADPLHIHGGIGVLHNSLSGLQGGDVGDYFHFTQSQHDTLIDGSNSDLLHTHSHNLLESLQGGDPSNDEFYHLGLDDLTILTGGNDATSLHIHDSRYYTETEISMVGVPSSGSTLIGMPTIDSSTFSTLRDDFSIFRSAGLFIGGEIILEGSANVISVNSGTGTIRPEDDHLSDLCFMDFDERISIETPTNDTIYIGIQYNAGPPAFAEIVIRDTDVWNLHTDFPLGSVVNEDDVLHITNRPHFVANGLGHTLDRFHETAPIARDESGGGLILGESGDGNFNVTVTQGGLWDRLSRFPISTFNTATGDDFDSYVNGVFEETRNTWDNLQYDNGGTIDTLMNNRWGVQWFYLELDGALVMQYGTSNAVTQSLAEAESTPSTVSPRITDHGILIGRIVFQKSAASATVETVFETTFAATGVTSHLNLTDIGTNTHSQIDTHIALVNEHIDWTEATQSLLTTGDIHVYSDSSKLYFGDSRDASIFFDGVDLNISMTNDNPSIDGLIKINDTLDMTFSDIINPNNIDGSVRDITTLGINANLELYLRLDGDLLDSSDSGRDFSVAAGTEAYADRGTNKVFSFDNSTELEADSYTGVTGTFARSVSVWARSSSASGVATLVAWGNLPGTSQTWECRVTATGIISLGIETAAAGRLTDTGVFLYDDTWHHIVFQVDTSQTIDDVEIWCDGVRCDTTTTGTLSTTINTTNSSNVFIGSQSGTANTWDGEIDEVAIFSNVLSEDDIINIFNSQKDKIIRGNTNTDIDWTNANSSLLTTGNIRTNGVLNVDGSDGLTTSYTVLTDLMGGTLTITVKGGITTIVGK